MHPDIISWAIYEQNYWLKLNVEEKPYWVAISFHDVLSNDVDADQFKRLINEQIGLAKAGRPFRSFVTTKGNNCVVVATYDELKPQWE